MSRTPKINPTIPKQREKADNAAVRLEKAHSAAFDLSGLDYCSVDKDYSLAFDYNGLQFGLYAHIRMPTDKRLELEAALDDLEKRFGKSAREAFARRAALDFKAAAPEPAPLPTHPQPCPVVLSDAELDEFRAQAKAHPWNKTSGVAPSAHIAETFAKWLGRGLTRAHIGALKGTTLGTAYAKEVSRDGTKRVKGLYEKPHKLPAGSPRPVSMRLAAERSPPELEAKRADNRKRDATRRAKTTAP